jgi:imidazolonepropionase-like amidohydrolase
MRSALLLSLTVAAFMAAVSARVERQVSSGPDRAQPFVITDVTLIDGTGHEPKHDMAVAVAGSRITYVGPAAGRPDQPHARVLSGAGKFLIPGLIDTHAHVTYIQWPDRQTDTAIGAVDDATTRASLRLLLDFGITTIRNPAAPTAAGVSYRDRIASGQLDGPMVRTAGEILNRTARYDGLTRPVNTASDVEREVASQAAAGVDFVKVYANLPPPLVAAAIRSAHAHRLRVIGHLQATSWTEAARLGIDAICHGASWAAAELPPARRAEYEGAIAAEGAMRARLDWLESVQPDGAEIGQMIDEIVRRRIPVDPTLIAYATKFDGQNQRFVRSPDLDRAPAPMGASFAALSFVRDWTPSDFERGHRVWPKMQALIRAYHRGGVLLTAGSDEPNSWIVPGPSLHTELELLTEAGLSPLEVLTIATRNGAEALGILPAVGTIETGKQADLVLLDHDPTADIRNTRSIALVVQRGRVVRTGKPAGPR